MSVHYPNKTHKVIRFTIYILLLVSICLCCVKVLSIPFILNNLRALPFVQWPEVSIFQEQLISNGLKLTQPILLETIIQTLSSCILGIWAISSFLKQPKKVEADI